MNILLSYCGLTNVRMSPSEKDLPAQPQLQQDKSTLETTKNFQKELNEVVFCRIIKLRQFTCLSLFRKT